LWERRFTNKGLGAIEAEERGGAEAGTAGGVGCFDVSSFCDGALPVSTLQSTAIKVRSRSSVFENFRRSKTNGPLTYGPIVGKKWSWTHIHQEVMVPCVVGNGHNTYPNIDTYPPIYRPGRSVTVDIDGRCGFTKGRIRSIL